MIKNLAILTLSLLVLSVNAQQSNGEYFYPQVGWHLHLPDGFRLQDSAITSKQIQQGKDAVEKSNNTKLDASKSVELFTSTGLGFQRFSASITPFDQALDGDYQTVDQNLKKEICNTFLKQVPNSTVDTASSTLKIGGLDFIKFRLALIVNGNKMLTLYLLSRNYRGYNFAISYLCQDDQTREAIEKALLASHFDR